MKSMRLAMRPEIRALGWTAAGSPIYPIWGCDPGEGTGEGTEGTGEGTTDTGTEGGDTGGDPTGVAPATDPTALLAQIETLTRRMQAADKAKGETERRLREYEDQGKSDLQKAQAQVAELTEQLARQQQVAVRARLEREILKHPGYTWHDPDTVLALVDMSAIEIDEETDKVRGVADALKKLAAQKPFLLKGKPGTGGGSSEGSGQRQQQGATGVQQSNGQPDDKNKRRGELAKKYRL